MNSVCDFKHIDVPGETVISSSIGNNLYPQNTIAGFSNNFAQSSTDLLNGLAARIAVYVPTLIMPIIDSPSETIIDSASHYVYKHPAAYDMFSLNNDYAIQNIVEVREYLSKNMDLCDALKNISSAISKYDGIKSVGLEHYHDIEEHWEKLYVLVETEIDDMDTLDELENTILDFIFEPISNLLSARVVLTVS